MTTSTHYEEAVVEARYAEQVAQYQDVEGYVMLGYAAALQDMNKILKESGGAIAEHNPVSKRLYAILHDKLRSLVNGSLARANEVIGR